MQFDIKILNWRLQENFFFRVLSLFLLISLFLLYDLVYTFCLEIYDKKVWIKPILQCLNILNVCIQLSINGHIETPYFHHWYIFIVMGMYKGFYKSFKKFFTNSTSFFTLFIYRCSRNIEEWIPKGITRSSKFV